VDLCGSPSDGIWKCPRAIVRMLPGMMPRGMPGCSSHRDQTPARLGNNCFSRLKRLPQQSLRPAMMGGKPGMCGMMPTEMAQMHAQRQVKSLGLMQAQMHAQVGKGGMPPQPQAAAPQDSM